MKKIGRNGDTNEGRNKYKNENENELKIRMNV